MTKSWFTLGVLVSRFLICLEVLFEARPGETKPESATVSGLITLKGEPARGMIVQFYLP